jgi:hypothetical protein
LPDTSTLSRPVVPFASIALHIGSLVQPNAEHLPSGSADWGDVRGNGYNAMGLS